MVVLFLFLIGLCMGSFLGVVIDRLPQNKSFITGRSHCDSCHHVLLWYDLIPVVSYFLLGGRCRYCHKKFSLTYPLFEVFVGVLLVGIYLLFGQPITTTTLIPFILESGIFLSLLVLTFVDVKMGILPDKIILFALLLAFVYLFFNHLPLLPYFLSGVFAALFFLLIIILTKGRGMGMGDAKLAFLLGIFLGWPNVFIAVYAAFLTGALVAIILVIARKKKFRGGSIAFGPFLVLGTFLSAFWGHTVWQICLKLLGI